MHYLVTSDIESLGRDWEEIILRIGEACEKMCKNDFVQPIKPYLRYGDPKNRIIAMPAYLGGEAAVAGIKWISSFPGTVEKGIQRAHSILILNDANIGRPICVINSGLLSTVRTAGVSAFILKRYLEAKPHGPLKVGMTGFGPIGRLHLEMAVSLLGKRLTEFRIYDPRPVVTSDIPEKFRERVRIVSRWQDAYTDADIFMTCTVSNQRYINLEPKSGSLHLNVSLRDYEPSTVVQAEMVVVDDWDEVCRENTDIEAAHVKHGLIQQQTRSIKEFGLENPFKDLRPNDVVMFHPMGMAIFDLAIGVLYLQKAVESKIGTVLPS